MTLFRTLCESSGISQREAARFLAVDERTARRWISGQIRAPQGVIAEMFSLIDRQARAAAEALALIQAQIAAHDPPASIDLGISADDHEAQALGWPTASAHAAVIRRAVESAPPELRPLIRIVPRGSTPATAAAVDTHGR